MEPSVIVISHRKEDQTKEVVSCSCAKASSAPNHVDKQSWSFGWVQIKHMMYLSAC
jgi:hypothetical protein